MPHLSRLSLFAACLLLFVLHASAEEKHRISITVAKRTIGQPTTKTSVGDERGRLQSLFVAVENVSSHSLAEGVLRWTAVVRKGSGGSLKYSGSEVLKALRSFQTSEIQCGSFEVESRLGLTSVERDRIDYEIVVLHGEKETARTVSTANFAALAAKAEPVTDADAAPAAKIANNPEDAPAKADKPAIIGTEKMPAQKPALPVAEIAKPAAEPPPVPQRASKKLVGRLDSSNYNCTFATT